MESPHSHLDGTSKLMRLPREIRDLIYHHLLVIGTIPIECAVTRTSLQPAPSPSSSSPLKQLNDYITTQYPLRRKRLHRKVWAVPAFDIDSNCTNKKLQASSSVYMTYQNVPPDSQQRPLDTQIFQVNKQLYDEACEVFYEKNIFSFTGDFRIPTAFAFLCDRPAASLLKIRSIELCVMESNNIRGTAGAHYPVVRRCTDSRVLQYAYNHFTDLCMLLSTRRMHLKRLYLIVESLENPQDDLHDVQASLAWEESSPGGTSQPPEWIEPLLNIQSLETIDIVWFQSLPRYRRLINTVLLMKQKMLVREAGITDAKNHDVVALNVLRQIEDLDSVAIYPAIMAELRWSYYQAKYNDLQLCLEIDQSKPADDLFTYRPSLHELLELSWKTYLCHCILSRTTDRRVSIVSS